MDTKLTELLFFVTCTTGLLLINIFGENCLYLSIKSFIKLENHWIMIWLPHQKNRSLQRPDNDLVFMFKLPCPTNHAKPGLYWLYHCILFRGCHNYFTVRFVNKKMYTQTLSNSAKPNIETRYSSKQLSILYMTINIAAFIGKCCQNYRSN